ncbi:MAG: DNA polymerase III subunit delta [Alphaproteobacteria bacterium]|nr:DNA polymerase III subunit delta [Alphaproteobacteria bacterium]
MKIPPFRVAAFLNNPDPGVRVFLVYGPDAGLRHEWGSLLAKKLVSDPEDPFCSVRLPASTVAADPARLLDEMAAIPFGGGRRFVRLLHAEDNCAPALSSLLQAMPAGDSVLLVEADDLDRRSKLRALCEGESPLACGIPCYVEDAAARQRTIADILKAEEIVAARDVVGALAEALPSDRLAMRQELEKFALYVGKGRSATMADVQATVQDAGAAEMTDLAFAVGAGDAGRVIRLLDRLYAEQASPVALLRAVQRHFVRLQWARAEADKGLSAPEAVKRLRPPVFWKHESAMAAQLRRWSCVRTEQALRRLYDTEESVKRTGAPDAALCAQALLALAA